MRVVTAGGVRQVGRGNIDGLCNVIYKSQATPAQTMNDILQVLVWEQCHPQVAFMITRTDRTGQNDWPAERIQTCALIRVNIILFIAWPRDCCCRYLNSIYCVAA